MIISHSADILSKSCQLRTFVLLDFRCCIKMHLVMWGDDGWTGVRRSGTGGKRTQNIVKHIIQNVGNCSENKDCTDRGCHHRLFILLLLFWFKSGFVGHWAIASEGVVGGSIYFALVKTNVIRNMIQYTEQQQFCSSLILLLLLSEFRSERERESKTDCLNLCE